MSDVSKVPNEQMCGAFPLLLAQLKVPAMSEKSTIDQAGGRCNKLEECC